MIGSLIDRFYRTIVSVESRPAGKADKNVRYVNPRQTRVTRFYVLSGMLSSVILGAGAMHFWFKAGLVHILPLEYAVIVVPIQLVVGIIVASILQAYT